MNASLGQSPRQRRLIINDDGEVGLGGWKLKQSIDAIGDKVETVEQFLNIRFDDCRHTHVDSYFFNIGATDRGPVSEGKPIIHPQSTMALYYYWGREGEIPSQIDEAIRAIIENSHDEDMEIFASIRMNDCHNFQGIIETTYPLKVQRPDLILGRIVDRSAYPDMRTSMLDRFGLDSTTPKKRFENTSSISLWNTAAPTTTMGLSSIFSEKVCTSDSARRRRTLRS